MIDLDEFVVEGEDDKLVFGFPFECNSRENFYQPAIGQFVGWALSQNVSGVRWYEFDAGSPVAAEVSNRAVDSDEALDELRKRAVGKYEIVQDYW